MAMIILTLLSAYIYRDNSYYRKVENKSFSAGEEVKYRLKFGIINAGVAKVEVDKKLYKVNDRKCYRINISGRTTGLLDWSGSTRVRDKWGTYLDMNAIIPQKSYRSIEEGRYKRYERVNFNHVEDTCVVTILNKESKKPEKKIGYVTPNNVLDLVSGYYYLRTIDALNLKKGTALNMDAFFEDEIYNFDIKYLGKNNVYSDIGMFECLIFSPILPENNIFVKQDPVKFWVTNDARRIPLRIQAKLKIGSIWIEIREYKPGD